MKQLDFKHIRVGLLLYKVFSPVITFFLTIFFLALTLSNLTLTVKADGTPAGSAMDRISSGFYHTCFKNNAGTMKCWGYNADGEFGNGNNSSPITTPTNATNFTSYGVVNIGAGNGTTCTITSGGSVKCAGGNSQGQTGIGFVNATQLSAVQVVGLTSGYTMVTQGSATGCALNTSGGVKCWGENINGEIGINNTTSPQLAAQDVTGLTSGVQTITAGSWHICALTTGGGVKCWGRNDKGQVGNNTNTDQWTPVDVYGLTSGVQAISGGRFHTCALLTGGTVKCWGQNGSGELGNGNQLDQKIPVTVVGLSGVQAISSGSYFTCALTTGGAVKCWGYNNVGQIGIGNTTTPQLTVQDVLTLSSNVIAITTAYNSACALINGGSVKCWGSNTYGQVGIGNTTTPQTTPQWTYVEDPNPPSVSATNSSYSWFNYQRTAVVSASDAETGIAEVRYNFGYNAMDGGCTSGGTVTSNGSTLYSPSGGTFLYLCARDYGGNTATWNGPYYWDGTAPTVSASNSSGTWFNSQINATVSSSDTGGSGLAETRYSFYSNAMNGACTIGGTVTSNGLVLTPPAGGVQLYMCARDSVGNTGTWLGYYYWENTPPSTPGVMTTSWVGDHYVNTSFTASTTGSTDSGGSGLASYNLCRSNDNSTGCSVWVATGIGTSTTVSGSNLPSEGTYRYYYWYAYDNAANQSSPSTGEYIRMDSAAPVLSSKTTFSGWYNSNQTSTFTFTDASSGIASGNNPTCIISTEGANQTCSVTPNVCDNAGNCNTSLQTSNGANIDKSVPTAPTLSCTGYTNNVWQNTNPSTTCSINDTASPSPRTAVAYSVDNGSNWTANGTTLSFSFTPAANTTTNVIMRLSDTGGTTNSNTYIIKVDTAVPSGTLTNNGPQNEGTQITYTASYSDTNGVSYSWDTTGTSCAALGTYGSTTTQTYTMNDGGTYGMSLKVKDSLGNESGCISSTATWNNVVPTISAIIKPADNTWVTDRQFCVTVNDTGGGNVTASFIIGGTTYAGSTVASGNNSCYTHTADLNSVSWYAYATDSNSGISSNTATRTAKIDTTAPSIPGTPYTVSPTNVTKPNWSWTASTDTGGSGLANPAYTVMWCQLSNFSGCSSNTATSNTNSFTHSTALSDGTWYFKVSATDIVSNVSSFSGNGSVTIDTTSPVITFNDDVSGVYVASDTINISVSGTNLDSSSYYYAFKSNNTCDGSVSYTNAYSSGTNFSITSSANNGKYICAKALNIFGVVTYKASANYLRINSLPTVSSVIINNSDTSINLTAGSTTPVHCTATLTDTNGYSDIQSVEGRLYRTSLGASGSANINNRYISSGDSQCVPSGGSGNTEYYDCLFNVQFTAEPTDAGSTYASDNWSCGIIGTDQIGSGSASTSAIEMNSLVAINVPSSISYGVITPGNDSEASPQSFGVTNVGNTSIDLQLSGSNLCSDYPSCVQSIINVSKQQYSTSSFTYGSGSVLGTSSTRLNLTIPKSTIAPSNVIEYLYFGIGIPLSTKGFTYSGTNTITVIVL